MNAQNWIAIFAIVATLGGGVVGWLFKSIFDRLQRIEDTYAKKKDVDRMEDGLIAWLKRVEDKLDKLMLAMPRRAADRGES